MYICVQKSEKCMHCAENSCTNVCACTYLASPNPLCLVSGAPKNLVLRVLVKKRLIHQLISGVLPRHTGKYSLNTAGL